MSVIVSSVKVNGIETEYAKFGKGDKPFVIIPGLSIKSVIESAALVESAYSVFSEDFTVYLFDRRENVQEGLSVYDMADDIAKALDKLKIKNACVFGTSQGGMIAQVLAVKYPELVGKLVLASTASRINDYSKGVISKWIADAESGSVKELCEDFVNRLYTKEFAEKYGEGIIKYNSSCTEEELKKFVILAKACEGFDVYESLSDIKCPVFVIGAEGDSVLTSAASAEIAEKINCELYIYPKPYAHAVYDEAPDYKQKLIDFFK